MLQRMTLDLPGLLSHSADCDCCVGHLIEALRTSAGVATAQRDAAALLLEVDTQIVAAAEVERLAHNAGQHVTRRYDHPTFAVEGMDCADCARTIERALSRLAGVHYAIVNFTAAKLRLEYDREQTSVAAISSLIHRLGYGIRVAQSTTDHRPLTTAHADTICCGSTECRLPAADDRALKIEDSHVHTSEIRSSILHPPSSILNLRRLLPVAARPRDMLTALCGLLIVGAWLSEILGAPALLPALLYILATLAGGVFVARTGWVRLRATGSLDINVLMTIAAIGALLIGEYAEGAAVVFLFAFGNALEGYTMERARRSIRTLMQLAPDTAVVLRDGAEREVPAGAVAPGEVIIIRPGDRIPLDGVVLAGQSAADQAPITGESVPVAKAPGAEVFAGSINGEGALEVQVTRPAQSSTLARIIELVEQAQAQKSRAQRFIDVFARYYTPAVLILAALVAILPPLVAGGEWGTWLYRALVLLVIACPCALVISTPVSIVSAISTAARNGVLFKGGAALEATGGLRAIAFDKTGTLTIGRPAITDVISFENKEQRTKNKELGAENQEPGTAVTRSPLHLVTLSPCHLVTLSGEEEALLAMAAAVERRSTHPLARAIVAAAEERGLDISAGEDFQSFSGRGAGASVGGRRVLVGSRALFADALLPAPVETQLARLEQAGRTAVLVGWDGVPRGIVALADQERTESHATVGALKRLGVAHITMLTGDNAPVAERVAGRVGVDEVRAGLLPDQKLAAIDDLLARHGRVGMVGDGINDAPALARATVGIAMGTNGSDTALETADVALMADDLGKLPFAIGLSRSARRVIVQNIVFALVVKALFLAATLFGIGTLWMAVFADTGAALIVIANGMRLLRYRD